MEWEVGCVPLQEQRQWMGGEWRGYVNVALRTAHPQPHSAALPERLARDGSFGPDTGRVTALNAVPETEYDPRVRGRRAQERGHWRVVSLKIVGRHTGAGCAQGQIWRLVLL